MAPFAVGADAIYLMGVYDNTYKNGANPPPSTSPVFVGRYDLDGARVWFQEFLFVDPTISTEPLSPKLYGAITIGTDGNPLVAINGNNGVAGPYLVRLKSKDGQLLP
jgi:hypothetical protein